MVFWARAWTIAAGFLEDTVWAFMLISVLAIRRERKEEEKGKARASKKGRRSES